MLYALD